MLQKLIEKRLQKYVRQYFVKHPEVKLVVVAGSVGKTSTKIAIGTVLSQQFRVGMHEGNHNSHISAPLATLGVKFPDNHKNIIAWLKVFNACKKRISEPSNVDVIVQELGIDRIGEMAHFSTYLSPDIAVVTAVTPEHMEYFNDIQTVAKEELAVANFSKFAVINRDDIDESFAQYLTNTNLTTYGTNPGAEYHFAGHDFTIENGHDGILTTPELGDIPVEMHVLGKHSTRSCIAAAAVAAKLGMDAEKIAEGIFKVRPVNGRMNILRGADDSIIIDDTYNSSPAALEASLETLYALNAPQKIAVLGQMNELGATSQEEHIKMGNMCDANQLDWVIFVGNDAAKYAAPIARQRGCQVKICKNALEAGATAHKFMRPGAMLLFKGSQGGVYLEEAVKIVLHATSQDEDLVRQSVAWMKKKQAHFQQ